MQKDVKILQDALRKSKLKSEVLEEMLKLSEDLSYKLIYKFYGFDDYGMSDE